MSKTTFSIRDIPDSLWRKVKAKCAMKGITIRQAIIDLLEAWTNESPR